MNSKLCYKCHKMKDLNEFYMDNAVSDGHNATCKQCCKEREKRTSHVLVYEKQCKKCGLVKSISDFGVSNSREDGHLSQCKECRKDIRDLALKISEKECSICRVVKPSSEFYINSRSKDGLYSFCKECDKDRKIKIKNRIGESEKIIPISKVCPKCKKEKDIGQFVKNRYRKDGHSIQCKDCIKEYNHNYYANYQSLENEAYLEKRQRFNEQANERNYKIKVKVLTHYANGDLKCVNPYHLHVNDITDPKDLTLDHINGDGWKEKDKNGKRLGGNAFYRKLIKNGYPEGLQVLCPLCQEHKRQVNKEYNAHYKRDIKQPINKTE